MAEEPQKLVLKPGVILPFLKNFQLSPDGESFVMTDLDLSNKGVEQLNKTIEEAKEVQYCNLSKNGIPDPTALKELSNLIHLNLSNNKVKNISCFTNDECFLNLKYLDLSVNKFNELGAFKCPKLEYLDISFNKIEKVNEGWAGHPTLKVFKSVDNKFKNLNAFKNMPKLQELYLYNNVVTSLTGVEGLQSLKKLHIRRNKIDKIEDEVPWEEMFPALEYLNMRSNKVSGMDDLYKLLKFPALTDLNVINCDSEKSQSSMNIMICQLLSNQPNPKIKRFCKVDVTDVHRLEAVYYADYQWRKAEEVRKEEEARKKAEEAAAGEGDG